MTIISYIIAYFLFTFVSMEPYKNIADQQIILYSCDFLALQEKLSALRLGELDSLEIKIPSNENTWVVYPPSSFGKSNPSYTLKCHLEKLPDEIAELPNLKYLGLSFLGLNTLPDQFQELGELQYLDLSFNKLNIGAEIHKLVQLKKLRTLNIHGCTYDKNDIELLKNEIPELSVQTEAD